MDNHEPPNAYDLSANPSLADLKRKTPPLQWQGGNSTVSIRCHTCGCDGMQALKDSAALAAANKRIGELEAEVGERVDRTQNVEAIRQDLKAVAVLLGHSGHDTHCFDYTTYLGHHIRKTLAREAKLKAALRFYADPGIYVMQGVDECQHWLIEEDAGRTARTTLEPTP